RPAQPFKEVLVEPTGLQRGLEDVLIIVEGVHQEIPDAPPHVQPVYIGNPPPAPPANSAQPSQPAGGGGTEADRLQSAYKALGQVQGHDYGDNPVGTKPPDFTKLGTPAAPPPAKGTPATPQPGGAAAPANAPPDSARRSNQAAGGPPGGQQH